MKILFQGDSITDVGRNTHNGSTISMGQGYPLLIAAKLGLDAPGKHEFINTGISGNRIVDVYARIKADTWNYSPDLLSILIGVNDVWHEVGSGNGVDNKRFYAVYRMLVEDTLERFPDIKLILMEPFVLPAAATEEHWDYFKEETALRGASVEKIAHECGGIFLPLQEKFDEARAKAPASYWLADGVHPTPAGHQLIANEWLQAFGRL